MVKSVTSLGRSGLHDWMIQRVTAVILASYVLCLGAFIISTPNIEYSVWKELFSGTAFKIFSFLAIVSIAFHAWIGLWIISTDYLKPVVIRMMVQILVIISCIAFLLWGAHILWSF